ncbi:MAG: hypothetical protein WCH01_17030 [Methylococcaceae bacterium]
MLALFRVDEQSRFVPAWLSRLASLDFADYMRAMSQDRHSGRDSHQAILPDAIRV